MNEDLEQDSRYASRKFILAMFIVGLGVLMDAYGELSPALVDLMKWVAGLYFGFNVSQKAAEWISTAVTKKTGE